jgi:chemotaxis protein CheD
VPVKILGDGVATLTPPPGTQAGHCYLPPGDLVIATTPFTISTVLGSCVAVCVWDAVLAIGGINHFLLPHGTRDRLTPMRYGNVATHELVSRMIRLGSRPSSLEAKVMGGASVIESLNGSALGQQNATAALAVLTEHRIRVAAQDVGGTRARRLLFNTTDGGVRVQLL